MVDTYWQVDYLPKAITAFGSKGNTLLIKLENKGFITRPLLKFKKPPVFLHFNFIQGSH
jgi:hypothetical protein